MNVDRPVRHIATGERFAGFWAARCGGLFAPRLFEGDGPVCRDCLLLDGARRADVPKDPLAPC